MFVKTKIMKKQEEKLYFTLCSYNSEPEDISIIGNNLLETVPSCNKKGKTLIRQNMSSSFSLIFMSV